MSAHGAPQIDERGIEHRHGCPMAGWDSRPSSVRGFHVLTCPGCGVVRLVRAGQGARQTRTTTTVNGG